MVWTMPFRTFVVLTLALAATACRDATGIGGEPGNVTIQTDRADYRPMELIVVTTINRSGRTVYDDHCGGEVQGFEYLNRWNASYGAGRGCVDHDPRNWRLHSAPIRDRATHVDTLHVNGQAYSGTWRVQLYLRDEAGDPLPEDQRTSNTFHVVGTWLP